MCGGCSHATGSGKAGKARPSDWCGLRSVWCAAARDRSDMVDAPELRAFRLGPAVCAGLSDVCTADDGDAAMDVCDLSAARRRPQSSSRTGVLFRSVSLALA